MDSFNSLVSGIQQLHQQLQQSAANAVNQMLTIRNWLIGHHIVEFEQNGKDRAEYGKSLLKSIAGNLNHIKGLDERSLRRFRLFYLYYPQLSTPIRGTVTPELQDEQKWGTLSPVLHQIGKVGTLSPQLQEGLFVPGEKILSKLSYSHIELLIGIDEALKRTFYELECIKGAWSVRELKRQINSLYFERSGLSKNPEKLAKQVQQKTKPQASTDIVKKTNVLYMSLFRKFKKEEMPLSHQNTKKHKGLICRSIRFVKTSCLRAFVAKTYFSEWTYTCNSKGRILILNQNNS